MKIKVLSLLIIMAVVLAVGLAGCGEEATTTTASVGGATSTTATPPTTSGASTTTAASEVTTTSVAGEQPQAGGVLRMMAMGSPSILGYYPETGPSDAAHTWGVAERLLQFDTDGNLVPILAESWDIDTAAPSLTWHLRQGVTFHDGTPWNAEALIWTFNMCKDAGRLQYADAITSMEAVDDHTVKMNLTTFNMMELWHWGNDIPFFSPTAIQQNGVEWARTNGYGTGPFMYRDFQRDVSLTLVKNPNYWRTGTPYLDEIDVRFVADMVTASAALQAGETDLLYRATDITSATELEQKGFQVKWYDKSDGLCYFMCPDSANPDSPFAKKEVREAVEYAIDRDALAAGLVGDKGGPLYQLAIEGTSAYNPAYAGREYNPEKAKELLAQAGYPDGFETTIHTCFIFPGCVEAATAVQASLAAVGIKADVDSGDVAAFFTMRATGWDGLQLGLYSLDPSYDHVFLIHFGPQPTPNPMASLGRTPEYDALANTLNTMVDMPSIQAAVQQLVTKMGEDAMVIPLMSSYQPFAMVKNLHFNYVGTNTWNVYEDWFSK